jgi:hypothetical protein
MMAPDSLKSVPGNKTGKSPFIEDSDAGITLSESAAICDYVVSTDFFCMGGQALPSADLQNSCVPSLRTKIDISNTDTEVWQRKAGSGAVLTRFLPFHVLVPLCEWQLSTSIQPVDDSQLNPRTS